MPSVHLGNTGATYYAKEVGSSVSPWATGVVAFAESTQVGVFAAATDDAKTYVVYRQLGGAPAISDPVDAIIGADTSTASLGVPLIQRSTNDTDGIRFTWPTNNATITGEVSLGGDAYVPTAGAVVFLRTEGGSHYYELSYAAADRQEGSSRYRFTAGGVTRFVNLEVFGSVSGGGTGEFMLDVQVNSTATGNPGVHGVQVFINGSVRRLFTNTLGLARFRVEAGSYTLSFGEPPDYSPILDVVVANVAADREVSVSISPVPIPTLDDVLLCNCLIVVLDQFGAPIAGATIMPVMAGIGTFSGNSFVFNDPATFTTDANGRAYMPLHRRQLYDFRVTVAGLGETRVVRRIPDLPTARITVTNQAPGAC